MKSSTVDEDQCWADWGYENRSHFENPSDDDNTHVVVEV